MKELIASVLIAVVLIAGCILPGTAVGTLQIKMTDKPVSGDVSSLILVINKIEVHQASNETNDTIEGVNDSNETDSSGWTTVVGVKTVDLMQIKGVEDLLGTSTLPPGKYTQVRVSVFGATVTINNVTNAVTIPSKSIKFVHPFDIQANATTTLLIDFNADQSLISADGKYILKPVVKLTTESQSNATAE